MTPSSDSSVRHFHRHAQVVAVRQLEVGGDAEHVHTVAVQLRDGTIEDAETVMENMDSGEVHYAMVPPPGAPAYEAHARTGLQLEIQTRPCPRCGHRVLFA